MTPSGMEPANFRAVEQYLNQMLHTVPLVKKKKFHKTIVNVGMKQCSNLPIDLYWFNY